MGYLRYKAPITTCLQISLLTGGIMNIMLSVQISNDSIVCIVLCEGIVVVFVIIVVNVK